MDSTRLPFSQPHRSTTTRHGYRSHCQLGHAATNLKCVCRHTSARSCLHITIGTAVQEVAGKLKHRTSMQAHASAPSDVSSVNGVTASTAALGSLLPRPPSLVSVSGGSALTSHVSFSGMATPSGRSLTGGECFCRLPPRLSVALTTMHYSLAGDHAARMQRVSPDGLAWLKLTFWHMTACDDHLLHAAGMAGSLQAQGSQLQRAMQHKRSAQSASTVWARHTLSLKVCHLRLCNIDQHKYIDTTAGWTCVRRFSCGHAFQFCAHGFAAGVGEMLGASKLSSNSPCPVCRSWWHPALCVSSMWAAATRWRQAVTALPACRAGNFSSATDRTRLRQMRRECGSPWLRLQRRTGSSVQAYFSPNLASSNV